MSNRATIVASRYAESAIALPRSDRWLGHREGAIILIDQRGSLRLRYVFELNRSHRHERLMI